VTTELPGQGRHGCALDEATRFERLAPTASTSVRHYHLFGLA
jgi:hypothetical protein